MMSTTNPLNKPILDLNDEDAPGVAPSQLPTAEDKLRTKIIQIYEADKVAEGAKILLCALYHTINVRIHVPFVFQNKSAHQILLTSTLYALFVLLWKESSRISAKDIWKNCAQMS